MKPTLIVAVMNRLVAERHVPLEKMVNLEVDGP